MYKAYIGLSLWIWIPCCSVIHHIAWLFYTFFPLQGWSLLGWTVSLSPLETARAFLATLIIMLTGRCLTANEILQFAGLTVVRYVDSEMIVVKQSGDTEEGQNDDRVSIMCCCGYNGLTTTFRVKTLVVKMKIMNYYRFWPSMPPVWQATSSPNSIKVFLSECHFAQALTCFAYGL